MVAVPSSSLNYRICFPPVRQDLGLEKTMSAAEKVARAEWSPAALGVLRGQTSGQPSSECKGRAHGFFASKENVWSVSSPTA